MSADALIPQVAVLSEQVAVAHDPIIACTSAQLDSRDRSTALRAPLAHRSPERRLSWQLRETEGVPPVTRQGLYEMAQRDFSASPLYQRTAHAVADDAELLSLANRLPSSAFSGGLFFATIQFVTDGRAKTREWWNQEALHPASNDAFRQALRELLTSEEQTVHRLIEQHKGAQLNEVSRCAYLVLALAVVAADSSAPLAVVDVGASAGLNLNFDLYSYDYGLRKIGSSAVTIHAELHGDAPVPSAVPKPAWKLGIDRHPIGVHDPTALRWLRAFIPADDTVRRERLDAALAMARENPAPVVAANAVDVARLAAEAPGSCALTIITTAVLMYLPTEERRRFRRAVEKLAATRTLYWIACEPPAVLESLGDDIARTIGDIDLSAGFVGPLVLLDGRPLRPRLLAHTGPHAQWIRWAEPAS